MKISLRDLVAESRKPRQDQRPLGALDLPIKRVDKRMSQLDTSWTIWEASENIDIGGDGESVYPKGAMNWCVANTCDSFTYSHMDNLGTITWARIENASRISPGGVKIWGVCHWPDIAHRRDAMARPRLYESNPALVTEGVQGAQWEFYALRHGDTV